MSNFKEGDRVVTPSHGAGTAVCWDMANDAWPGQPVRMINTGRLGIKLDNASLYPWFRDGIAYFYPNDLTAEVL